MKQVCQLNASGYFIGLASAQESPLEPGVFLLPGGSIDTAPPAIPEGQRAKWNGAWVLENLPQPEPEPAAPELTYAEKRMAEYPSLLDYIDGVVKGDQAQIDKYISECLAVKAKYPKP